MKGTYEGYMYKWRVHIQLAIIIACPTTKVAIIVSNGIVISICLDWKVIGWKVSWFVHLEIWPTNQLNKFLCTPASTVTAKHYTLFLVRPLFILVSPHWSLCIKYCFSMNIVCVNILHAHVLLQYKLSLPGDIKIPPSIAMLFCIAVTVHLAYKIKTNQS